MRDGVRFSNSDPKMVSTFLTLFRRSFEIREEKLKALLHLHDYHDENEQIHYWSAITKIPSRNFLRSYRKRNTKKRIKKGYPGCIALYYYDSNTTKMLKHLYEEFAEYIGV